MGYFNRTSLRNSQGLIDWFNSEFLTNNFSESFNAKLKANFGTHHSNIWIFVEKLGLMIDDLFLEHLRIENNLSTTRQRDPNSLMILLPELKNRFLRNELTPLQFLFEHLGIDEVESEIQSIFEDINQNSSFNTLPDIEGAFQSTNEVTADDKFQS